MTRIHYKGKQIFLTFLILSLIGAILNSPSLKNLGPIDGNDLISFANASSSNYLNTTVHSGDLIIQQNETIVIRDAKYIVEGNIRIYGNLTLENSELLIRYDASQYRGLSCYSSGNLTAINSTLGYEGAPEWYSFTWWVYGIIQLKNATVFQIELWVSSGCKIFSLENSIVYRVCFQVDMRSNSSLLIENGYIIDPIDVNLPVISFIGRNVIVDCVTMQIWCYDYSNLTIRNTSTMFGLNVETRIYIYIYGHSVANIENSTAYHVSICENSTVFAVNSSIRYVSLHIYVRNNGYLSVNNGTLSEFINVDHPSLVLDGNCTIEDRVETYVNCYANSTVEITNTHGTWTNRRPWNVYLYDGFREAKINNSKIQYVQVGSYSGGTLYVYNSTITGMDTSWSTSVNSTIFLRKAYVDWMYLHGSISMICDNSTVGTLRMYDNSSAILNNYTNVKQFVSCFDVSDNCYIVVNGSQIISNGTANPQIFCDETSKIQQQEIAVYLHNNASGTLINANINDVYCYDNSTVTVSNARINFARLYGNSQGVITSSTVYDDISLRENSSMFITDSTCNSIYCYDSSTANITGTSVGYMAVHESASLSFVDSSVDNLFCYGQSMLRFDFSDAGYVHLSDGSCLSSCNSTFDSVYSYSGTSVYLKNSVVNYLYADNNVSVTLADTFVSSPSYSDPSSIEIIDTQSPVILVISYYPSFPSETDTITFTVQIRDMAIAEVILLYSINNGSWAQVSMVEASSNTFSATIGPFPANSTLFYKVVARDQGGRETESSVHVLYIKGLGVSGEPSGEEGGESAGVSPGGVRPSGNLFSILFSVILLLVFSLFSTALYTAIRSRAATVMEKVVKPRLGEEETPFGQVVGMVSSGDYEGAYNVIRSVENVDEILSEIPSSIRVGFSSWLLNRFLEDGFYDRAVDIALKMRDLRRLRAIYLGIAMKKLAEGDKKEAIGFFEKATEVSERMGDKKSAKAIRKNIGKIY